MISLAEHVFIAGIRPVDFYGNFYMSNTTDVELAVMDSNQAINIEIKHDDKLSEADGAFIQVRANSNHITVITLHDIYCGSWGPKCQQLSQVFMYCIYIH